MTGAAETAVAYTIFKKLPTCMTFGNNVVGYQLSYFCVNAGLACENLYYVYAYHTEL